VLRILGRVENQRCEKLAATYPLADGFSADYQRVEALIQGVRQARSDCAQRLIN
jgi:hypothetical protein